MAVNKEAIRNRIIAFEDLKETQIHVLNKFCEKKLQLLAYWVVDKKDTMDEFTGDLEKFKRMCKKMRDNGTDDDKLDFTIQGHPVSFGGDFLAHDDPTEVILNNQQ